MSDSELVELLQTAVDVLGKADEKLGYESPAAQVEAALRHSRFALDGVFHNDLVEDRPRKPVAMAEVAVDLTNIIDKLGDIVMEVAGDHDIPQDTDDDIEEAIEHLELARRTMWEVA